MPRWAKTRAASFPVSANFAAALGVGNEPISGTVRALDENQFDVSDEMLADTDAIVDGMKLHVRLNANAGHVGHYYTFVFRPTTPSDTDSKALPPMLIRPEHLAE